MGKTWGKPIGEGKLLPRSPEAKALGVQFRKVRIKRGVTLGQLRDWTGLCVNTIRGHEAGSVPFRADDLVRVARAMGVQPVSLFKTPTEEVADERGL